jgi:Zn-dependent protease with chaperone function
VTAAALILALFAAACIPAGSALAAARWTRRSPAVAIVLWQALGLGWGLAAVGALAGLGATDRRSGVAGGAFALISRVLGLHASAGTRRLLAGILGLRLLALAAGVVLLLLLCWILVAAFAAVARARRRQRILLSLLAHGDPKVPGALVVDHPAAAAYCVPGLRSSSRIVISAGALDLLDQAELAAVIAHERAHLRERHDLVLLPFIALLRAFRWSAVAREAHAAVVLRVGAAGGVHAPNGALAAADGQVAARVTRLLKPAQPLPMAAVALIGVVSVATVAIPAAFLTMPF